MKAQISNKVLFSDRTTDEQTALLNKLLGTNEYYFSKYELFNLIFRLPYDIIYNNKRGYLFVGPLGIEYSSLNYDYKVNVIYSCTTVPCKDLCDCFIETLEFFKKNQDNIQILDAPEDCIIDYIKITDIN